jgi:hypothetical protein
LRAIAVEAESQDARTSDFAFDLGGRIGGGWVRVESPARRPASYVHGPLVFGRGI